MRARLLGCLFGITALACGGGDEGEIEAFTVDTGGGTPPASGEFTEPDAPTPTTPMPTNEGPSVDPPIDPGPAPFVPLRCFGDASQVAMIGDSYLAFTGEATMFLQGISGQAYRTYYVSGTQLVGGLAPSIPDQARIAFGEGPVQTIIMTGGGNDVLIGDVTCRATGPAPGSPCEATVLNVLNAARGLMDEAAATGVKEVIYFFYPHLPPGLLALNHIALNDVLDFAAPLAMDLCENNPVLDCSFIDLRPSFEGHPEYIGIDGIHPTTPGSEVIAHLIWAVMDENCRNGIRVF